VLAFKREGYRKTDISLRDSWDSLAFPGFWKLASRYWRVGAGEIVRSFSKPAFAHALQRLVPEITVADLEPGGAGVRAQALNWQGELVSDFQIGEAEGALHVLNAPSPAATASLAIGEVIVERAAQVFGWKSASKMACDA
jgi:L-2-hydroxyglutarate oxidase